VFQASFIIKNAYKNFPKETIHILGLNPETTSETSYLAIYADGHYFIGPDNGIFSLIFDVTPDLIVELNLNQDTDYLTFPTKDLFVKAACHIARGGTLEVIGKMRQDILEKIVIQPVVDGNVLRGNVIYIDSYKNAFTNITEKIFADAAKGRNYNIYFGKSSYNIRRICKSYGEVPAGEMLALFSSTGFLEIAINKGNADELLGLQLNDMVRVEFI
ncbi:MAG: SAM-dependent chlorinase/fluorinase, partial [Flavobacteriales bacterium]|nr:SAM-dependent chlorinase/fluorinase [Flavobacteriales bacterium]